MKKNKSFIGFDTEYTQPFGKFLRKDQHQEIEEFMKNLTSVYTKSLITNIDDRFKESLPILSSISIFNPLNVPDNPTELSKYGQTEMKVIAHDQLHQYCMEYPVLPGINLV